MNNKTLEHSPSSYKKSRSLSRGLAILEALNTAPNGSALITELSQKTSIHRTTVKRLLETLISEGYVRRSLSDNSYKLNHRVRQLSEGFTDDEWISELATPAIGKLLQQAFWPSDLCTLDGSAMVIRETTHRFSSLSFHRSMIRRRLPLLTTAAGRAYFCFCSSSERQQLLSFIKADATAQAQLANSPYFIQQLIDKTRTQGYASNEGDWDQESNIAAIALPVFYQEKILSTINIVFLKKILTPKEAAEKYLDLLKQTINDIEKELAQRDCITLSNSF